MIVKNGFDLDLDKPVVRRSGLRLTLFADIDPAPRKTWLVENMLGAGELSVIFGAPSGGKSALATHTAACIAAHRTWLGRTVLGGAVLYVAAERAALVKRRLAAWRRRHGTDYLPLGVLQGTVDLRSSKEAANEIIGHASDLREMTGEPVVLIIIDTVSRVLAGGDENSPKDMGALVANASVIQEATGAHVCLIHHIPADGSQRLRGHGALLGAVDTSICVEKHPTARTATVDKQNDGEEGERVSFSLESVEIADDGTTAPVVVPADAEPATKIKIARRLPDRVKAALDVLTDLCVDGKPLSAESGLPASIRAVPLDIWRDELYRRGALDADHKNPREDFRRVKVALQARHLAAEREGQIWAV